MKILLVNPPKYKNIDFVREGRCMQPKNVWNNIWPPLTLNYLATILQKTNHIKLIDCIAEKKNFYNLKNEIESVSPEIIIINNGFPTIQGDLKVGEIAKNINKNIVTIAFGIFPTLLPEETLDCFKIDYAILCEPEITIQELIGTIKDNKNINNVNGIAFKKNNKIIFTKKREFLKDLDNELGIPDRDIIKNELYNFPFDKKPFTLILLARGCPYKCTFCVSPLYYGKKFRTRDPKKVVDEIEICINKYNIINFIFWGESFTLKKRYGMKICNEIIKRKLKLKWVTTSRVDTLDLELLKKMKKAGCYLLGLGIETPNEEILKNVRKLTTIKDIKKAITLCKQAGIKTMGHFMFGLPGETRKTAKKTIKFAKNCGVDYAQFYCAVPYPKTEYWKELKKKNQIVSKNWDLYQQNYAVIKTSELTPQDIMNFRTKGFNSFYIRAKFFLNHLKSLHSLGEIYNTMGAISSVVKWFVPKKR